MVGEELGDSKRIGGRNRLKIDRLNENKEGNRRERKKDEI